LVTNFVGALKQCDRRIQERMVWHFFMCEDELGQRIGEGLGISADDVRDLPPLQSQTLSDDELERAKNLGKNGSRDVSGKKMTHCVPNERATVEG
ncbi:MAG: catalase-related domain-containing protein, partial [Actinomycetes bacterium]